MPMDQLKMLKGKYIGSNKNFKRDRRYHNRYSVTFYKTNIHEVKEKNISAITVYRYLSYVVQMFLNETETFVKYCSM